MAVWLVRAGRRGERESLALEKNVVVIGWEELPDLSGIESRSALEAQLKSTYPDVKPKTLQNWLGQIWSFVASIQKGDLVTLPLKTRSVIAIGEVTGPYQYRPDLPPDARHTRPVQWLKELPRTAFDQDLLYSLGAFMTVCRIQRNQADERIHALVAGQPLKQATSRDGDEAVEWEPPADLEQFARDQIRAYIGRKFKGHALARLVASVLESQGYNSLSAPPTEG